jgi:1-acyl-sn-glycerol-3-phosphate acyltransferase
LDKRKVIYYTDELNDEFSTAQIKAKRIDAKYIYCHDSVFKRFTRFFWYRIVATPITFLYVKLFMHRRLYGKEKLKPYYRKGYFLYGNHTHDIGDAMTPTTINFPQQDYCIVHANNVSMPVLGRLTPSFGAIPLPDDKEAYKNFIDCIERRIGDGHTVVIYPEAHIWPYYTKIRPFTDVSFQYPVKMDRPVFCFTNTYQKRAFSKKPRTATYIDGPFFADKSKSIRDQRKELRDTVFKCMCERAKNSDVELIKYIKREESND